MNTDANAVFAAFREWVNSDEGDDMARLVLFEDGSGELLADEGDRVLISFNSLDDALRKLRNMEPWAAPVDES